MKLKENKFFLGISLVFCVSLAISLLFFLGFLSNIQIRLSDNLYGGKSALNSIALAAIDDKSIQEIGRWPWNRSVFAKAISQLKNAKVIGIDVAFFEKENDYSDNLLAEAIRDAGNIILTMEYSSFEAKNGELYGKDKLLPIEGIREAAKSLAYVNVITDADGIARALHVNVKGDYDNFASAVYKEYWKKTINFAEDRFLINFAGKPGSFKLYSLTDVLNGRVNSEEFSKKIVLIGATAPDLHDEYFVPTSEGKAMPGVEMHANAIQTMINRDFLSNESKFLAVLSIFAVSFLVFFILYKLRISIATPILILIIIFYIFFSIKLFDYGIIMNLIYVPLAGFASYIAVVAFFYLFERREKKRVIGALEKYISKEVADEIMKNPESLKLGGERKRITVMFSDIRGFTSISEKLTAEQLVRLLNEYLTEMTEVILNHKGVVDKYIGDAIMAFWGAPLEQPKQAELACKACIEMMKSLAKLNKKLEKENFPEVNIGMGLNTGECIIGNMGSYERFDYTAIGDEINLGSRLEGLNKEYATSILISESTRKEIGEGFIVREIDLVAVKGKKQPVKIYELVGTADDASEEQKNKLKEFEKGLNLYRKQKFDGAIKMFKNAGDSVSQIFIQRCLEYKKNPPPEEWDGVSIMKTK